MTDEKTDYEILTEPEPLPPPEVIDGCISRAVRGCDLKDEPIQWLIPGWIARGVPAIFQGKEDGGKTLALINLAARLTSGEPWPFEDPSKEREPEGAMFLIREDSEGVIRRRLIAAGADMDKILVLARIEDRESRKLVRPKLTKHLRLIEREARRIKAGLIIIDPLWSFLGVRMTDNERVEEVIDELAAMAQRLNAAVVMVRHFTKDGEEKGKGFGGVALEATAKTVLTVKAINDLDRRITCTRMGFAKKPEPIFFRLPAVEMEYPCVEWIEAPVAEEPEIVVSVTPEEPQEPDDAVSLALLFLRRMLADGPVAVAELGPVARAEGVSPESLKRAKKAGGIRHARRQDRSLWFLPEHRHLLPPLGSDGQPGQVGQVVQVISTEVDLDLAGSYFR